MFANLKRIGLESCVLIAFAALFGLTLNHQLVMDAFNSRLAPPPRPLVQEQSPAVLPLPVMIDEVRQLRDEGGLIIDARSPELYAMGHIDGAVSLPMVEVDTLLNNFLSQIDKAHTLVIYCSGFGCPDSFDLAVLLLESGFRDVRVFEGGYPEWRDAGLPVAGEQ